MTCFADVSCQMLFSQDTFLKSPHRPIKMSLQVQYTLPLRNYVYWVAIFLFKHETRPLSFLIRLYYPNKSLLLRMK